MTVVVADFGLARVTEEPPSYIKNNTNHSKSPSEKPPGPKKRCENIRWLQNWSSFVGLFVNSNDWDTGDQGCGLRI